MNEQQLLFGEWTVYFVKQKCERRRLSQKYHFDRMGEILYFVWR